MNYPDQNVFFFEGRRYIAKDPPKMRLLNEWTHEGACEGCAFWQPANGTNACLELMKANRLPACISIARADRRPVIFVEG